MGGPGKQVFNMGRKCTVKPLRESGMTLHKCMKACREDDACELIYSVHDGKTCYLIREIKEAPSEWIWSDDRDEKGSYYSCAEDGEEPWMVTKEPTAVSELVSKSCSMVAGKGQTMDKSWTCEWIAVQNVDPIGNVDWCLDRCKGIDCNYAAFATDTDDENMKQCVLLKCDHEPVFKEEPAGQAE